MIDFLRSIPTAIWSVALGSLITFLGVLISNSNNRKRLEIQLNHDAELKKIEKTYSVGQGQDVVIKCKTRLAWLIWEAKLRGYELKPATIFSLPDQFSISKDEPGVILMPLTSLTGVAENSAQKVYETIKTKPLTSYEDMLSRKDDLNRTIFNKKVLTGLGLNDFTIAMQQKFFMFLKRHNEQS